MRRRSSAPSALASGVGPVVGEVEHLGDVAGRSLAGAQRVDGLVAGDRDEPAQRAAAAGLEAAGAVPDLDEGLLHGFLGVAAVAKDTIGHSVEFPADQRVEPREGGTIAEPAARQQPLDVVLGHARRRQTCGQKADGGARQGRRWRACLSLALTRAIRLETAEIMALWPSEGGRPMNTMEMTKFVGAVCGSLLIFLLIQLGSHAIFNTHSETVAYAVEGVEEGGAGGGRRPRRTWTWPELWPGADVVKGETVFKKCAACHKIDGSTPSARTSTASSAAPSASVEGFSYSDGYEGARRRLDARGDLRLPRQPEEGRARHQDGLRRPAQAWKTASTSSPTSSSAQ